MRNHLPHHRFVRMMLLLNTLQQPSHTMMPHLVKIPLLMLLLTGLVFFFLSIFLSTNLTFPVPSVCFFNINKSSSLSHVACRSQWSRLQLLQTSRIVPSALFPSKDCKCKSSQGRFHPPFVSLLYSSSLAFIIFLFVFLWVQRCNLFLSFFLLLFLVFSNPRLLPLLTVVFFLLNLDFRSIYQISPSFPSLPETFSVCLTLFFHLSFCVTLISVYINRVFFFFF